MSKITENRFTDKEYAEYMLANKYLGYSDIALFIAAVLFEKYLMDKTKDYKKAYLDTKVEEYNFSLNDAITIYMKNENLWSSDVLCKYTKSTKKEVRDELDLYRRLRNEIVHEDIQRFHNKSIHKLKRTRKYSSKEINIDDFLQYIYISITDDVIHEDFFKLDSKKTLLQDYKIKEINERMLSKLDEEYFNPKSDRYKKFQYISADDFENLFKLREKMVFVKKAIANYSKEYALGLTETILSPIDTTSAYIWMPFINNNFTNKINKFETKRNNLVTGSTSILATPIDFRVYIDFGGGDYKYRLQYQDFLQSKEFNVYIQRYRGLKQPLELFDIRWYSFITKRNDLFNIINNNKLDEFAESAKKKINIEQKQENIMTSGYNKIGFILPSRDIKLGEIVKLFECITHIYYEFLQYECNDKSSIDELKEKQNILRNRCKYDKE